MGISESTRTTLDMYIDGGVRPGSFVRAVLANDLMSAFELADCQNKATMEDIVKYVFYNVPHTARGSYEAVAAWIEKGGILGHKSIPTGDKTT